MPDQHIDVQPEALYDSDSGEPILTREHAQAVREEWTAQHPPIPGLRWSVLFNINGEVSGHDLVVLRDWHDAYAPPVASAPPSAQPRSVTIQQSEANRLGALAYHGWRNALPDAVRESGTEWDDVPEPFRHPLREAAVLVWQHAENAGFHEALLRTLPSAQLGAAGELENIRDLITAQALTDAGTLPNGKPTPPEQITVNLKWLRDEMTARIAELRKIGNAEAKRERDARRPR